MSAPLQDGLVMAASVIALIGASVVVFAKDAVRMLLGLGALLLAVAALFGLLGATFLAVAEVFVYVGGVLVLFLFAIMLVHRSSGSRPVLESRHDVLAAVVAVGVFAMLFTIVSPLVRDASASRLTASADDLARVLVGPQLFQFEVVGVLLLAALIAAVSILRRERE